MDRSRSTNGQACRRSPRARTRPKELRPRESPTDVRPLARARARLKKAGRRFAESACSEPSAPPKECSSCALRARATVVVALEVPSREDHPASIPRLADSSRRECGAASAGEEKERGDDGSSEGTRSCDALLTHHPVNAALPALPITVTFGEEMLRHARVSSRTSRHRAQGSPRSRWQMWASCQRRRRRREKTFSFPRPPHLSTALASPSGGIRVTVSWRTLMRSAAWRRVNGVP